MIRFWRDCQAFYQNDFTIFFILMSSAWKFQFLHILTNVGLVSIFNCSHFNECVLVSHYGEVSHYVCAALSDLTLCNQWAGEHHPCRGSGHESSSPWAHSAVRAFTPFTENFPLLIPSTQWLISLLHHFYCLPSEKMLYLLSCFVVYLTSIFISPYTDPPHLFKGYIIVHSLKVLYGFNYSLLLWISIVSIFSLLNKCCSCPLLQYI